MPRIAVVGLPDLPAALRTLGLPLLSTSTEPAEVAAIVRSDTSTDPIVVIAAGLDDARVRTWVSLQASQRRPVITIDADPPVAGTRGVTTPITVGDLLRQLKVPESKLTSPAAQATITASGAVVAHQDPEPEIPDWEDPVVEPAPPAATFEDLFDDKDPEPDPEPAPPPAPVRPPRPAPVPAEPEPEDDVDALFTRSTHRASGHGPVGAFGRDLAPVILCFAGRGGVGKSTFSICLGERAATVGGLRRVVVVDGNRTAGSDLRKYLRLSAATPPLATIYDAIVAGDPTRAIIGPRYLNQVRGPKLPELNIGLVMAPRAGTTDVNVVTIDSYAAVIEAARRTAELVIVDTQTMDDTDTSGLFDGLWLPMLASGAWGVGITDTSTPGVSSLSDRLQAMARAGVSPDRLSTVINRFPATSRLDPDLFARSFGALGEFAGVVHADPDIARALELGSPPHDIGTLAGVLDAILHRVTGLEAFTASAQEPARTKRPGFLSRLGRR